MSNAMLHASTRVGNRLGWLDPRLRLVMTVLFALVVVSLSSIQVLVLALGSSVLFTLVAGLTPHLLLRRLVALESFMLVMLVTLPFSTPGQSFFQLGILTASQEGLLLAVTIVLKANAVTFTTLALVGTLEPESVGHAMARLGMPRNFVQLFLLCVRYISVIQGEYQRLRNAMRARAFVPRSNRHTWRTLGWLLGMLLVRSFDRSQRVLAAMKCRGFSGEFHLLTASRWQGRDTATLTATMVFLTGLILWEYVS